METTIKTVDLEFLAEKLNGKYWSKGDLKRIYLDAGYNTKKMSTKTYVYQREDGAFNVKCSIDCPSQNYSWIESQQNEIIESTLKEIDEIIEEFGQEVENPAISIQASLDAEVQVQGYYMRWYEVRIKINSYGKLADRKRQKVHTYKGASSRTPNGFIELNDNHFEQAVKLEQDEELFSFGETPNFKD